MACNKRNHCGLEQALEKMRRERNVARTEAANLFSSVVRLKMTAQNLETALHEALEKGAEAQVQAEARARNEEAEALHKAELKAVASAGFRLAPDLCGDMTLWCLECDCDSGLHWSSCSRGSDPSLHRLMTEASGWGY